MTHFGFPAMAFLELELSQLDWAEMVSETSPLSLNQTKEAYLPIVVYCAVHTAGCK